MSLPVDDAMVSAVTVNLEIYNECTLLSSLLGPLGWMDLYIGCQAGRYLESISRDQLNSRVIAHPVLW